MRESLATLVTQTANGVAGVIVANIPDNVMHTLELEQRDPEVESAKEAETPWGYQLCPLASSNRGCGIAKSRMHLFAVAGLSVTGALVIYTTTLHMEYLGSEEVAATLFSTSPSNNFTTGSAPAPPNRVPNSSADANSSVSEDSSVVAVPSTDANSSISAGSGAGANASVVAYSPPLDSPSIPIDELSPVTNIDGIPGPIPNPARVYVQNMSET